MIYSVVIDSFISEILRYESWILASWRNRSWTVRFTPLCDALEEINGGNVKVQLSENVVSGREWSLCVNVMHGRL